LQSGRCGGLNTDVFDVFRFLTPRPMGFPPLVKGGKGVQDNGAFKKKLIIKNEL
jgi:hypothetical protein